MSSNVLRKIETDDVIIYQEQEYSDATLKRCREIFDCLVLKGEIKGGFDDDKWMCYSDIRHFGVCFAIDPDKYKEHIGKEFGISYEKMGNMLRCYAIYCNGEYIYNTIAREKINVIREFLENYGDDKYKVRSDRIVAIEDFLAFISTPDEQMDKIIGNIRQFALKASSQRQLSPIINYLVIGDAINELYSQQIDDEIFIKWFPVYFWANITFILPLRATEMLVTPYDCIKRENGKVYLSVRRTLLKKGKRTVYYDVTKDYGIFAYEMPDNIVVRNIDKYQTLTKSEERRFIFQYSDLMVNEMLSLQAFNTMITSFMEEYVIGNTKYDYARFSTGIKEFETVTAGDSRPIAMANLYFQNQGEDICRQLADHENINTSSGYYTNISETIWASSVMQLQKKLNYADREFEQNIPKDAVSVDRSICTSPRRECDREDLTDCIEQGHLSDCMGCVYYMPTENELNVFMEAQKNKADEAAATVIDFMNRTLNAKNCDITMEEAFLKVQTEATRYRMGCNIKAKEKYSEWQGLKNLRKNCF